MQTIATTTNSSYETIEDIAQFAIRFTDRPEPEYIDNIQDMAYSLTGEGKIDNLYRSDWEQGYVLDVLALGHDDEILGRLTGDEFFGQNIGF